MSTGRYWAPAWLALLTVLASCENERRFSVQVPASVPWTKTKIAIPDNSTVFIEAIGTISPNGVRHVDASGSDDTNWNENYNLYPGVNHCALIAKIGAAGKVLEIGVSREIEVSEGGILILGINDNHPENNEGSFEVSVKVLTGTE